MAKGGKKQAANTTAQEKPAQAVQSAQESQLPEVFLKTIKESLTSFNKLSEDDRKERYGDQKLMDQFRNYFKEKNPDLLGKLNKEDLPEYLAAIENKGFSIGNLTQNADKLHTEFSPEKPEREVMQESLGAFSKFCKDPINSIPADTFSRFASFAGFNAENFLVDPDGTMRTIDDLYRLWKSFLDKEGITLTDNQKQNIEQILCPNFDPVERIMVKVAIEKIRKELKGKVKEDFDEQFSTEIDAFSVLGTLTSFRNERLNFLTAHANEIDESQAKKLDRIIVTNGDIKKYLVQSGRKLDVDKHYSEREKYYRIVFNRLATRQLFDEMKASREAVDHYFGVITSAVKDFPPYMNEVLKIYPYDDREILKVTPNLGSDMKLLEGEIIRCDSHITNAKSEEERNKFVEKKRQLREQREKLRRNAYIKYLATKDLSLAGAMKTFVENGFNLASLDAVQQQRIVSALVENKMRDLIKNKAPELLGVRGEELDRFVHDLFDLRTMDLTIPTVDGDVHIKFSSKGFVDRKVQGFLGLSELATMENLPLNFTILPTPSSEDFFEKGVLFQSIFPTFKDATGREIPVNDGYKVRLTKDGKTVEGYLSQYPPEKDASEQVEYAQDGQARYLYSQPVTYPSQERAIVTWEGTPQGTPVAITKDQESEYELDVLSKSFHLNGEAISALVFSYILGQQSFIKKMTPEQEQEIVDKLGKLKTYEDTLDKNPIPAVSPSSTANTHTGPAVAKEKTELSAFYDERDKLSGYRFDGQEYKDNHGVKKGTKLLIKSGDTLLPPQNNGGPAWMQLTIDQADPATGMMSVKLYGGEFELPSGFEGMKKKLPMNKDTLDTIKDIFGGDIYKMPDARDKDPDNILGHLKEAKVFDAEMFAYSFDKLKWDSGSGQYKFTIGDFVDEEVVCFGYNEKVYKHSKAYNLQQEKEAVYTHTEIVPVYYKYKRNKNGTFTVYTEGADGIRCKDENGKEFDYSKEMDAHMFMLFITGKRLEPKTSKEIQEQKDIHTDKNDPDRKFHRKKARFSINNLLGFVKGGYSKVMDRIKKYDEERIEDLTDLALKDGDHLVTLGKFRGHFSKRIGESMETAGMDYYTQRDDRTWKKIEKWQKIYEQDAHFPSYFWKAFNPMINLGERPKDPFKIPAMLLALINKEKTPYARGASNRVGKGHWVNMLLGKDHQKRYLSILNREMHDVKQNAEINGIDRTIYKQDEISRMEMKYLIDVIDMRRYGTMPDQYYWAGKWSRKFTFTLEDAMKKNRSHSGVEEKYKSFPKTMDFEFAMFEYNRHVEGNKYGKAIPFLKMMAEQAQNEQQWELFNMHVTSGLLSGLYMYHTDALTKGWIKDICRTRGFVPGIWLKDMNQSTKALRLLNIFSGGKFQKETGYNPDDFTLGHVKLLTNEQQQKSPIVGKFAGKTFQKWRTKDSNGHRFSKFLELTSSGKNDDGKDLVSLSQDPSISEGDRALLQEFINNSQETSQDLDQEVRRNPMAHAGSPFTKCETIVGELLKYDKGEFEGADSHIKFGPQMFWKRVHDGLPKGRVDSPAQLQFYLSKFLNRFDPYGFDGAARTVFLRRLRTISQMYEDPRPNIRKQADDTLRYTIDGTIISKNSAGHGTPPREFQDALKAFRNLFKDNLKTILSSSMISAAMGPKYANDPLANKPYTVEDRGEYIQVMKNPSSVLTQDKTEKDRILNLRKKYTSDERVMYEELYTLAEGMKSSHNQPNGFKKYFEYQEDTESAQSDVDTPPTGTATRSKKGLKLTNPETLKNLGSIVGSTSKKQATDKSSAEVGSMVKSTSKREATEDTMDDVSQTFMDMSEAA